MLPDDAPADWNQPFLNLVAHCRTGATPTAILDGLKQIERALGREDRGRWAPRPIDLDLLLYGRETIASERLKVPHPGIIERAFVLTPLAALEPNLTIPGRGTRTVLEHARAGHHHLPLWMGIANLTPDSFSDGGELASYGRRRRARRAARGRRRRVHRPRRRVDAARRDAAIARRRMGAARARARPPRRPLSRRAAPAAAQHRHLPRRDGTPRARARRRSHQRRQRLDDASHGRACGDERRGIRRHAQPRRAGRQNTYAAGERRSNRRSRALARGAPHRVAARGTRFQSYRLRSRYRLRQERTAIVATDAQHRALSALTGCALLVGHSRKSFMHHVTAASRAERDLFTVGTSLRLCDRGVDILRVHDVAMHAAAYRGWSHAS